MSEQCTHRSGWDGGVCMGCGAKAVDVVFTLRAENAALRKERDGIAAHRAKLFDLTQSRLEEIKAITAQLDEAREAIRESMAVMEKCLNQGDSSMRAVDIAEAHFPLIEFMGDAALSRTEAKPLPLDNKYADTLFDYPEAKPAEAKIDPEVVKFQVERFDGPCHPECVKPVQKQCRVCGKTESEGAHFGGDDDMWHAFVPAEKAGEV